MTIYKSTTSNILSAASGSGTGKYKAVGVNEYQEVSTDELEAFTFMGMKDTLKSKSQVGAVNGLITQNITGNRTADRNGSPYQSYTLSSGSTYEAESAMSTETKETEAAITSVTSVLGMDTSSSQGAQQLSTKYTNGSGRLADFTFIDGSDDEARRAYMQLQGETASMAEVLAGEDKTLLQSVYNHLINKYTSVVILSLQENMQEKQHIMATVGDSFAATFSGQEPQVVAISGYLPFDGSADTSWFLAFVNAYKYFMRASRLAKYRCYLNLVFPDFSSYKCYPISFTATLSSEQDMVVPFSMNAIVMQHPINKAYGYSSSITKPTSTVEEVAEANSTATKTSEIQNEVTKDPKEIGKLSQKKSFVQNVQEGINSVLNSKTMQSINKTLATTNQVVGAINVITGKSYGKRYFSGKIGRGSYD